MFITYRAVYHLCLQDYIECAEKLYNAKVERADFTNDVEDTRYKINKWIEDETHGECNALFICKIVSYM